MYILWKLLFDVSYTSFSSLALLEFSIVGGTVNRPLFWPVVGFGEMTGPSHTAWGPHSAPTHQRPRLMDHNLPLSPSMDFSQSYQKH